MIYKQANKRIKKKGFTLVELVMVIVILGILAAAGLSFFTPLMRLFFYLPDQLRTQQITERMAEVVIEGDSRAKGLRTAKEIYLADNYLVRFLSADNKEVTLEWSPNTKILSRTISLETATETSPVPPEYPAGAVLIEPIFPPRFFRYFNYLNVLASTPISDTRINNMGRIELNWQASTSTTKYRLNTGVDTKMR